MRMKMRRHLGALFRCLSTGTENTIKLAMYHHCRDKVKKESTDMVMK